MEIRDKLFTEEQYLSQLKLYNEEILYYEQLHRSGKHIGYDSLFNFRLRSLLVQFSVGKNLEDLKGNYMEIIRIMPRFWTEKGFYIEMLWMLSIGIMLEYDDNTMQKLVQLIKDNDVKIISMILSLDIDFLIGHKQLALFYIRYPIKRLLL